MLEVHSLQRSSGVETIGTLVQATVRQFPLLAAFHETIVWRGGSFLKKKSITEQVQCEMKRRDVFAPCTGTKKYLYYWYKQLGLEYSCLS